MDIVGVIDIGSNTVRLVLTQVRQDLTFTIIDDIKESVRLGEGFQETGALKEDRMEKAIQTLAMFKNLCTMNNVSKVIATATAAVRKASNQQEFLKRVKEEVGIVLQVLSGEEEAYYDYVGVVNSLDVKNGLLMDIGGGSTELVWIRDRDLIQSISLPFGSIDLAHKFQLWDRVGNKQMKQLEEYLFEEFEKVPWLSKVNNVPLIGVGGTIRNIGKIKRRQNGYPVEIAHNYRMEREEVDSIYQKVSNLSFKGRKNIKGLSKDRADIFVGASSAVSTLMNYCCCSRLIISGYGLREGLLFHEYTNETVPYVKDILEYSIHNAMIHYNVNKPHAYKVFGLVKKLFEGLKEVHGIQKEVQNILKTAALLHDCGIHIHYYNHHEHSFYMILHSPLHGLTHRELIMSAYIAGNHRTKKFKKNPRTYQKILTDEDMEIISKLGILLQIAESLDRSMDGVIEDVSCLISKETVTILASTTGDGELEMNEAILAEAIFKKIFHKKLMVQET